MKKMLYNENGTKIARMMRMPAGKSLWNYQAPANREERRLAARIARREQVQRQGRV